MGVLGADDGPPLRMRLARGRQCRHRRRGRGVLDVPVPAGGKPEQLREPGQGHLLELGRGRRGPPENRDVVERRRQQLGEDPGLRGGGGEVGEEARMLPVRDTRQQELLQIAKDVGEGLRPLRRLGREPSADLARVDPRQDGKLAHPLQVARDPLERGEAVLTEGHGPSSRSISAQGRVFTI
jgi:hypothetical protein